MREAKITIICDICGAKIDIDNYNAIALLDIRKTATKLNTIQLPSNGALKELSKFNTEKELLNMQIDICEECLKKVENFLETIKNK